MPTTSTKKLKVGIVGTGGIFKWAHKDAWKNHPEAQIVALCDIVPGKADEFKSELAATEVATDYHDLLKLDLDIIDICTPNLFHSEVAVAALNAGINVLTEKPDAINPTEAAKMADAARKSGKLLMAMRNNRFTAASQFLKKFVTEGHAGDLYTGRCGWIRRRGIPGAGGWFTTKALSGGGPLIDLGVHMIDVATWLMGNPKPVTVSGSTYRKFAEASNPSDSIHSKFGEAKANGTFDVEDLAIGFIRFDNAATLQIEFSWASNIEQESSFVELRGSKAGFALRDGTARLFTETLGSLTDLTPKLPKLEVEHHPAVIHHFVDCVQHRAQPTITPEQGHHMIQILDALYQSAASNREIQLT